uniref:Uncharacterized protein n=1 Tax=Arundo donax TaxID=35708 RepID=A0A0A9C445_ARUDO
MYIHHDHTFITIILFWPVFFPSPMLLFSSFLRCHASVFILTMLLQKHLSSSPSIIILPLLNATWFQLSHLF